MPRSEGLIAEISTIYVEIPGDKVRVQYRKGAYTGKLLEKRAMEPNEAMLADLIMEWDLTRSVPKDPNKPDGDKHDEPYPITKDDIMALPQWFVTALIQAINRDTLPNRASPVESQTL